MSETPPEDDQQFARGNPFARAVRGPVPDDEKATSPVMYVVFGLLSLVLVAMFVAALVLPPMFMYTLIIRGVRAQRPGMLVAGLVLALVYCAILWRVGRRLMGPGKAPPAADQNE
jgi:hypothetical protein